MEQNSSNGFADFLRQHWEALVLGVSALLASVGKVFWRRKTEASLTDPYEGLSMRELLRVALREALEMRRESNEKTTAIRSDLDYLHSQVNSLDSRFVRIEQSTEALVKSVSFIEGRMAK